jgi:tetratricopeptide (TPR) repeat protein
MMILPETYRSQRYCQRICVSFWKHFWWQTEQTGLIIVNPTPERFDSVSTVRRVLIHIPLTDGRYPVNKGALLALEKKLEKLRLSNNEPELIHTLNILAYDGLYFFPPEKSENYASEANLLAEKCGDDQEQARSLLTLGVIKMNTGNYSKANTLLRSAMGIYMKMQDMKGVAAVEGTLGNLYWTQEKIGSALEHYLEAIRLKEDCGVSEDVLAASYYNLGSCYLSLDQLEKAESSYEYVRSVWESMGDQPRLAFLYNNIGTLAMKKGDQLLALDYLGKALEIRLATGQEKNAASTLHAIANVQKKIGNIEDAIDCLDRSIFLCREIDDKRGIAYSLCEKGKLLIEKEQFKEADDVLGKAMALADELDLPKTRIGCLEGLMDLHEAMNNLIKAISFARQLRTALEENLKEESAKEIAELQVQYETEKKEKEAEIYRLRNIELTKTNEELRNAVLQIKKLQGMLPICSHCKKIRDDTGYWEQIESYISKNSETVFSHGICPDCLKKLYGESSTSSTES